MKILADTSRVVLVAALLSVALAGCNRDASTQASGTGATSGASTTPGGTGTAGSSGSSGTSGSSAAGGSAATPSGPNDPTPAFSSGSQGGTSGSSSGSADSSSSSGASGTSSTASAGAMIDDSIVSTKVKTALLADAEIKGTDIVVETNKGEVLLSGFVKSQAQVDKAVKVAGGIEGVKKVNNKMTVKQ